MDIFQPEYSQGDDATSQAHDQSGPVVTDASQLQDAQAGPSVGILPEDSVNDADSELPLRGKAATHGLSNEEKKERQKQQNRRAAERSRNKKREELTALEMTVNNIQDENHRLRSRLSALLAAKVPEPTQPPAEADAVPNAVPGPVITATLDYEGLSKLQAELASAKATLSSKEVELGRLRGELNDSGQADDAQHQLLTHAASLKTSQSEVASLHALINHLRADRDSLARQRDVLSHEISARRALREFVADSPSTTSSRANGVERALLELRGVVDGVVKTWEQSSVLTSITAAEPNAEPSATQADEKT